MRRHSARKTVARVAVVALAVGALAGCNTFKRLSEIGDGPTMSGVDNPTLRPDYRPVSMPMPAPMVAEPNPSSLWVPGARSFFKDQRAGEVGDLLTVIVDISNEKATFANNLSRSRDNSEGANLTSFLGFEGKLADVLPDGVDPASLTSFGSDSKHTGNGSMARSETVSMRLAAVVLQILPNGNFVIAGKQEVRVNGELRELTVTGVIRPEDIRSDNTIYWHQIAEARISYGGRGTVTDMVEPRYGQQVYDILFPF
ncbi:flagellar basal body L-ring protein [Rhodospirillum rubrum]|uniref:flagellar basal body L-ring protein FlgH n=1 Tax=Rhodospirillum rubrum TaxID=1085 RepID=UPI0019075A1A|nr:flagellar basal body L-ring protein FlgH [Rhodospirillum rubrum]MBK1666231.1 flagellar basal body L-ring protein [Rhodospirillum rubrum]MBK1677320.1 flagellar basal body L-ring protein [Rhodospirillum rubrum]